MQRSWSGLALNSWTVDLVGFWSYIEYTMGNIKYDEDFKRNVVRLIESGQRASKVARDLGLHSNQLYGSRKRYWVTPSVHGNTAHNQDGVTQLRAEL